MVCYAVKFIKEIFNMTTLDQIILAFSEYKLTHKEVSTVFAPLCIYEDFLKEEGYYRISYWNPNGWEVEFWNDYYNPKTKDWVTLSGSLYYGNFHFELLDNYDYDEDFVEEAIEYAD